jgi:hypothetical protein
MELFRRIALGLVATASALVARFATIQSPSNNLASTNIDNSISQQTIVEEKEATTIYNSAPQTQELDQLICFLILRKSYFKKITYLVRIIK